MNDKTIHQKLVEIQQTLKVAKNQRNTFGNYNFRSCEDILEAVKPLLGDLSLVIDDEVVNIGDRYYIKAKAYLGDGKNGLSSTAYAREALEQKGMSESQITGSASSYARKYALNGLFCIDDTKDADTMDNTKIEASTNATDHSEIVREPVSEDSHFCHKHNIQMVEKYSEAKKKNYWSHKDEQGICFGGGYQ